jgi:hypothetical protein
MTSIEQKILASAADLKPGADRLQRLRDLVHRSFDANQLLDIAIQNGVGGLLYRNLKKADALEQLGPEASQKLHSIYYQTVRLNLKLIHDLKAVLKRLNQKNINVVLLQGITLLNTVYEDVGLRPMKDIDLWVLPDDYDRLIGSLEAAGYEKEEFYPTTYVKDETAIDINTHILWADRIKARGLLLNKSQGDVFRNTVRTGFEDQIALCLNPCDQVLYLSLHVIKHHAERLIWLLDIKGLVEHWAVEEWKALIDRAQELGLQKAAAQIVFLLELLLEFQLPAGIQPALQAIRLSRLEKMILRLRLTRDALPGWCQIILLPAGKGLHKRMAFIMETLYPRPEILKQVFAGSPNLKTWQLYWKRSLQLMGFPRSS